MRGHFSSILRLGMVVSTLLPAAVACQPARRPAQVASATASATATSNATSTPTLVPPKTPPALPEIYQTSRLDPLDTPHTYIEDTCHYLRAKWDPENAPPGTVVMIIMLHSINQGKAEGGDAINISHFGRMMEDLHGQQFQAINMQQLVDFLESNAKIPVRSAVLLQDGRHYAGNFDQHFRPYWDQWGWPVVNAWESVDDTSEGVWADQVALEKEGLVDHQVYGVSINPAAQPFSDEYLTGRLKKPIELFQERFHKTPTAIVWPTGFTAQATKIARGLGYRLGFTFNARGPVMFNWVPLADAADKSRPSYLPEGAVGDALMTLPRYWPYQVHGALDSVRLIGREAAAYAEQNRAIEIEYYDIMCAPTYGPIS